MRSTTVELAPRTTTLGATSVPAGVPITVGDATVRPGQLTTLIRGGSVSVSAPATWTAGGTAYRFGSWGDGSLQRSRDLVVTNPATVTATYVPDAPDTCPSARSIRTGSWHAERASGDGDEDWFSFRTPARGRVVVSLGDLPVDARLGLYSACGTPLATSDATGTHFEELTRTLAAGTYRIRVTVPSDARSMAPYVVRAFVAGRSLAVKSATVTRGTGSVRIAGEVLNARGSTVGPITVTVRLRNAKGAVVRTLSTKAFGTRIGAGGVTPFSLTARVPGWTSLRYSLAAGAPHASRSLSLSAIARTIRANGTVAETGSVRNTGRKTARPVTVARTWYGRRGEVLATGQVRTTPSTLRPGATGRFTIIRPALTGVQATRTRVRGS